MDKKEGTASGWTKSEHTLDNIECIKDSICSQDESAVVLKAEVFTLTLHDAKEALKCV